MACKMLDNCVSIMKKHALPGTQTQRYDTIEDLTVSWECYIKELAVIYLLFWLEKHNLTLLIKLMKLFSLVSVLLHVLSHIR